MTFTFNTGVPAAGDNPSVDQPDMLSNNVSTNSILAVDHISFNTAGGGQHVQIHFNATPNYIAVPPAPVGNDSIEYTQAGVASPSAQLIFNNSNSTLPLSLIKAWGFGSNAGIIAGQSSNIASFTLVGIGNYRFTLVANTVTGVSFGVIVTASFTGINAVVGNYVINGANDFSLRFFGINGIAINPISYTFVVYQI